MDCRTAAQNALFRLLEGNRVAFGAIFGTWEKISAIFLQKYEKNICIWEKIGYNRK